MMTEKADNGKDMTKAEAYHLDPLEFFVSVGNYKQADYDKMLNGDYFDATIITKVYEASK